jgi:cold shock CspA family protein
MSKHNTWTGGEGTAECLDIQPTGYVSPRKEKKEKVAKKPPAPQISTDYPNRLYGKIVRYNSERNFGFLEREDDGERLFFHASAFPEGTDIRHGQRISFEVSLDIRRGKTEAANARIVG